MYPFLGWSTVCSLADKNPFGFTFGKRCTSMLLMLMASLFALAPNAQAQSDMQTRTLSVMPLCSPDLQQASVPTSTSACELPLDHDGVDETGLLLCQAEQVVDRLITRIRHQQSAIAHRRAELDRLGQYSPGSNWLIRARHAFSYVLAWLSHQLCSVTDYWRIGSLEGSLLIAYSKLGAARQVASQEESATGDRLKCQLLTESSVASMVVAEF